MCVYVQENMKMDRIRITSRSMTAIDLVILCLAMAPCPYFKVCMYGKGTLSLF